MNSVSFDPLDASDILKGVGFSEPQTRALVDIMRTTARMPESLGLATNDGVAKAIAEAKVDTIKWVSGIALAQSIGIIGVVLGVVYNWTHSVH